MLPAELNEGNSHVTIILAGTMGYTDLDYLRTGQVSTKRDVYYFGIVLLQLIVPRRAFDIDRDIMIQDDVKATLESRGISGLKEEFMDPLLRDSSDLLLGFESF